MRRLAALRNPYVAACVAVYGLSLGVLAASGLPLDDSLVLLAVFGCAFPLLAWMLVRRAAPAFAPAPGFRGESGLLTLLIVFVSAFLGVKGAITGLFEAHAGLASPAAHAVLNLALKLLAFVVVPLLAYRQLAGFGLRQFGFGVPLRSLLAVPLPLAFAATSTAALAVQAVLGHAAQPVMQGEYPWPVLVPALLLGYLWLALEAGLVEEVFFRAILQTRLEALLASRAAALLVGALIFGLAHAPGLYLRGAMAFEGLSGEPSLLFCAAYAVATMSLAGLFLGVLWMYTRNLWLVVGVHAMVDLLPNTPQFIRTWGLGAAP